MTVALRELRGSPQRRPWLEQAYRAWLAELGASAADLADSSGQLAMLLAVHGHALLIERDGEPVGFALLRTQSDRDGAISHHLLDFFVTSPVRRLGVGGEAARLLIDRFPGRWEILTLPGDTAALQFWRRVLGRLLPGRVRESREPAGVFQRFASNGPR
jgi:predicted acetyltransferase